MSNSGRLKATLSEAAEVGAWPWTIALEPHVDGELRRSPRVVVSSDAIVLDGCGPWLNLARAIIDDLPAARPIDAFGA